MPKPTRKPSTAPAAAAAPVVEFPIARISIGSVIDRVRDEDLLGMLSEQMTEAYEHYLRTWDAHTQKLSGNDAYKLKPDQRLFRGVDPYFHPLQRARWTNAPGEGENHVAQQLERALKAQDWQEVMIMAGMLVTREMLYGRPVKAAAKPAAAKAPTKPKREAKAPPKGATIKPAAKKPAPTPARKSLQKNTGGGTKVGSFPFPDPVAPRKPAPADRATTALAPKLEALKALVDEARPHFKAHPDLDRAGLIAKLGHRRYERLTTFDELRALCAGKTPTVHSLTAGKPEKAARPRRDPGIFNAATPEPWPHATAKPARIVNTPVMEPISPEQSEALDAWPQPNELGCFSTEQADHCADFKAGAVAADFHVINTESGWTHGFKLQIPEANVDEHHPLSDTGPLALDADTAIRDATAGLLVKVNGLLKESEPSTDRARTLAPHVPTLLKLRNWLLGFQARGVEKIEFLRKNRDQLELAA